MPGADALEFLVTVAVSVLLIFGVPTAIILGLVGDPRPLGPNDLCAHDSEDNEEVIQR